MKIDLAKCLDCRTFQKNFGCSLFVLYRQNMIMQREKKEKGMAKKHLKRCTILGAGGGKEERKKKSYIMTQERGDYFHQSLSRNSQLGLPWWQSG